MNYKNDGFTLKFNDTVLFLHPSLELMYIVIDYTKQTVNYSEMIHVITALFNTPTMTVVVSKALFRLNDNQLPLQMSAIQAMCPMQSI